MKTGARLKSGTGVQRERGSAVIEEGKTAPDFELDSDSGQTVKLSDFRGRPVVLYFYPKDDTPGCTTEACEFRDAYDMFRERGAEVLGVSPDDVVSHEKFKTKYELPFTLLADPGHEVAEKYGVWGERKFAGKSYMGINRSTFVIDQEGKVARALRGIKPAGHAAQVLDSLP
jgi:peroxiredoxin Q/BCP